MAWSGTEACPRCGADIAVEVDGGESYIRSDHDGEGNQCPSCGAHLEAGEVLTEIVGVHLSVRGA